MMMMMAMFIALAAPVASFIPLSRTIERGSRRSFYIQSSNTVKLFHSKIPFIVEQIGKQGQPSKSDADEISSIVISVFFQEEAERLPENRSKGSITKPLMLAYLKNLQYGDVRGKKFMLGSGVNNSMFVARRVVPCHVHESTTYPKDTTRINTMPGYTLDDLMERSSVGKTKGKIYNRDHLPDSSWGYRVEDILGFVDVTEKIFGLPSDVDEIIGNNDLKPSFESSSLKRTEFSSVRNLRINGDKSFITTKNVQSLRPVLTNLSVKPEARCSGVGTALVDACEDVVMESLEWSRNYYEMVLEVEEENVLAQKFYEKKGYMALFSDPSSRRYDTSGLLLSNVRTTKICYRKDLTQKRAASATNQDSYKDGDRSNIVGMWLHKVRQAFFGIAQ
jgi:ribosomal protein S18 acetylase RimI-like enzyme